jgi:hypothetical protein
MLAIIPVESLALGAPLGNRAILTADPINPLVTAMNTLIFLSLNLVYWYSLFTSVTNGVRIEE